MKLVLPSSDFALLLVLLPAPWLAAQISVQAGARVQVPAPNATAAVSLDASVAEASLVQGIVTIIGIEQGYARVVLVSPGTLNDLTVVVSLPPPKYPPGFVAPPPTERAEGSYELRFDSDNRQFENLLDAFNHGLQRDTQIHVTSATFADPSFSASALPSLYYRITTQQTDATLFDQTVSDSPLTLDNAILRGFHLREGRWRVHAGYTTTADFVNVIVPVEKEFAAGVSYSIPLGRYLRVVPHAYYFRSVNPSNDKQNSALLATLLFQWSFPHDWRVLSEIGAGRGQGIAFGLDHSSSTSLLRLKLSKKATSFPTVRTNPLPGLIGDFSWTQLVGTRLGLLSGADVGHLDLQGVRQDTTSAYTNARVTLSRHVSAVSGASYGSFTLVGSPSSKTVTFPEAINIDGRHIGVGFQYQVASAAHGVSNGTGEGQSLRLDVGRFQFGEFLNRQTQAVTVSSPSSTLPQLQRLLQRQALIASSPELFSRMLQGTSVMQSLGLTGSPQIVAIPSRVQTGGNVSWNSRGSRPHQVTLSLLVDYDHFAGTVDNNYTLTTSYSKPIGSSLLLQASSAVVQSSVGGQRQVTPVFSVSLRRFFTRAPSVFSTEHYTLSGSVFVDLNASGIYQEGVPYRDGTNYITNISVILDDKKITVPDQSGGYSFTGLTPGAHRLRLQYNSDRPHFFTTPSQVTAAAGSVVNFGINFPAIELWGYVRDDAGDGLEGIQLQIEGPYGPLTLSTDRSGKFSLRDIPTGSYKVQVIPESVPVGYATEDLAPVEATVSSIAVAHPTITIPAVRVLTGSVVSYDAAAGVYKPVKGATISIPQLSASTTTNDQGRFSLGGLPAGEIEIVISAGQHSLRQRLYVPNQPVTLREDYKISALNGGIIASPGVVTPNSGWLPR